LDCLQKRVKRPTAARVVERLYSIAALINKDPEAAQSPSSQAQRKNLVDNGLQNKLIGRLMKQHNSENMLDMFISSKRRVYVCSMSSCSHLH